MPNIVLTPAQLHFLAGMVRDDLAWRTRRYNRPEQVERRNALITQGHIAPDGNDGEARKIAKSRALLAALEAAEENENVRSQPG